MAGEEGGLIDHTETNLPACKDCARALAAAARIEIVAVEIEKHHARSLEPLEKRIEPRRVETPGIVKLVEIAKRRGCGRDHRIHIFRRVGSHQSKERSKRLPGEHDAVITLVLQLTHQIDQPACADRQGIAVAQAIEAKHVPAGIAQHPQIRRRRRVRVFGVDRAAMVPDDSAHCMIRADKRLVKRRI
jgi:hypothetical protein